jgi:hypothetical protein
MADVCIALALHRSHYRKNEKRFILANGLTSICYGTNETLGIEGDLNRIVAFS